jgi:hypothetical protein
MHINSHSCVCYQESEKKKYGCYSFHFSVSKIGFLFKCKFFFGNVCQSVGENTLLFFFGQACVSAKKMKVCFVRLVKIFVGGTFFLFFLCGWFQSDVGFCPDVVTKMFVQRSSGRGLDCRS